MKIRQEKREEKRVACRDILSIVHQRSKIIKLSVYRDRTIIVIQDPSDFHGTGFYISTLLETSRHDTSVLEQMVSSELKLVS